MRKSEESSETKSKTLNQWIRESDYKFQREVKERLDEEVINRFDWFKGGRDGESKEDTREKERREIREDIY